MRVTALFLLMTLISAPLSAADVVILKNGQRISGSIDPNADVGPDQVAINTGNGILRIPKSSIATEDLSYEARKARLNKKDHAEVVALALWCRSKGLQEEALKLLDLAVRHKEVSLITRALHVRLVDEIRGPEKALELYRKYRDDGGDDPSTLARLKQLEDAIKEYEQKTVAVSSSPAPEKALPTVQGGLETKGWKNEALQWSNPVRPELITITTEAGAGTALKIECKGGERDKATIKRSARLSISSDSVLTFFAKNTGKKPLPIAIAVKTGSKYLFHESPQELVKPGDDFQKVKFDLKAANFKSAASKWQNNTPVADINDVKEIQVLIYNGKDDAELIITGMGFPTTPDL